MDGYQISGSRLLRSHKISVQNGPFFQVKKHVFPKAFQKKNTKKNTIP